MYSVHKPKLKTGAALAALAALGLAAARPALAQTYTFTTLDDPLAGSFTNANGSFSGTVAAGINASGEIVGYYFDSAGQHGFTETAAGFSTLDFPNVAGSTGALGISNAGQIVGGYGDGTGNYGFVYTPGAGFAQISEPSAPAGSNTFASGVNDSGQIVGNYTDSTGFNFRGFLDTPGSGGASSFTTLADPKATSDTFARGINNNGQVVGYYAPSGGVQIGYLLAPGGGYSDIIDPAAPKHTFPVGINDLGQVAGYYLGKGGPHGFVETPGTAGASSTFATLDDPLTTHGTYVQGISNNGQVVGYYSDANNVDHGFLATPAAVPEASSVVSFGVLLLMGAGGLLTASRKRARTAA